MSFTDEVKSELLKEEKSARNSSSKGELYALMLFLLKEKDGFFCFESDSAEFAQRITDLIMASSKKQIQAENQGRGKTYSIRLTRGEIAAASRGMGEVLADKKEGNINTDFLRTRALRAAFLRGAFLSSASVTNPEKGYHLEFVFHSPKTARAFKDILQRFSLYAKMSENRQVFRVYFKESAMIEDFLNIIGAKMAAFKLMDEKVLKDVRNMANRASNCDNANIEKTVYSSYAQCEAIRFIEKTAGLDYLGEELKETALLRLNNPDLSLNELKDLTGGAISRSGIYHRLKKIVFLREELDKE